MNGPSIVQRQLVPRDQLLACNRRSRTGKRPREPRPTCSVYPADSASDAEESLCRLLLGRSVTIAYARTPSNDVVKNACHHALLIYLFGTEACAVRWRLARGRQFRGRLPAEHACVIPPNTLRAVEWESAAESLVIYIEPALYRAELSGTHAKPAGQGCVLPPDSEIRQLAHELRSACIDLKPRAEQAEHLALSLTARVDGLLRRGAPVESITQAARQPRLTEATVRRIDDYIQTHLAEEIRLVELARIAELPVNRLTECIRRATGFLPSQYIARRRLEQAKEMLSRHPYKIRDVARQVGYPDPTNFSERFKTMFGCRPKTFRALAAECRRSTDRTR